MIRPRQYVFLLGFALLPHILEIQSWVWFTSAFVVGWALWTDHKPQHKPNKILINAVTLLFPALIYIEFGTLMGPDAATSLLLLMISLKLFEVYAKRDAIIILALILLMAMYHLVFRQDLYTTVYMVIVMVWTFYLLYKLHRPTMAPKVEAFQVRGLLGLETLVSIPLLLALFFFFPRFSSPIGRFIEKQGDTTGFSDNLRPGDIANMANSEEVAFRVEFKGGRPLRKDELYFRGSTLDVTDGINWTKAPGRIQVSKQAYDESLPGQHYRITFEPRFKEMVFSLEGTTAFRLQSASTPPQLYDNATIKTKRTNQIKFQLVGVRNDEKSDLVNSNIDYLKLPNLFSERNPQLVALTGELQEGLNSNDAKMQAVRDYFKNSDLTYSFETPQYDNLDQILFRDKLGFCEHFASAATAMARSMDVPSRVVIGFQGGELNEYGNYLVIRDKHAHAWMEYVNDQGQWERLDPTSQVSGFRITQGLTLNEIRDRREQNPTLSALAKNMWNMIDNLNNQFALALLEMNRNSQLDWLRKLGFESPNRKTIMKVFLWVIGIVLGLILLFLYLRKPKVNEIQKLRLKLINKLSNLNIGYSEDLGPVETIRLINEKKPDAKEYKKAVNDYANLRYSKDTDKTARELLKEVDKL